MLKLKSQLLAVLLSALLVGCSKAEVREFNITTTEGDTVTLKCPFVGEGEFMFRPCYALKSN